MDDSRTDRDRDRDSGSRVSESDDDWWDGDGGDAAGIASLLVLGLGLASLFGLIPIGPFWAIFAIGFAVVVPLVAILEDRLRDPSESENVDAAAATESDDARPDARRADVDDESVDAALDRLRDRYARGDLSDEQFESKLEALLETDTPEDARERLERRRRERERESEHEHERESESAGGASD